MEAKNNETTNNPVGRLFDVLVLLQSNASNQDERLETIISKAFNDKNSKPLWAYMEIIRLIQDAEKDVERLPERSRQTHLSSIIKIQEGFSKSSLSHQWAHFSKFLDPATMKGLELTADTLSHITSEKPLDKKDVDELRQQVQELLDSVLETEFDKELKRFIIERVEQIRSALIYYRINGAKGLKEVLENTIGAISIYDKETIKNTPVNVKEKLYKLLRNFAKLAAFLNDIKGLSGDSSDIPFLPGL